MSPIDQPSPSVLASEGSKREPLQHVCTLAIGVQYFVCNAENREQRSGLLGQPRYSRCTAAYTVAYPTVPVATSNAVNASILKCATLPFYLESTTSSFTSLHSDMASSSLGLAPVQHLPHLHSDVV